MIKEYDIVIVGAGAGGSAAAYNLSKLGLKLLLIEQGDFIKSEDYPSWNKNWEYKKFKEFSSDPNLRNNKAIILLKTKRRIKSFVNLLILIFIRTWSIKVIAKFFNFFD